MGLLMATCSECDARVYASGDNKKYACGCGAILCGKHAMFYVDESNSAISASARAHCPQCWAVADVQRGVVGIYNLLISGDYQYRQTARARLGVVLTSEGSRVVTWRGGDSNHVV